MPNPISRLFHRSRVTVPKAREPEPEPAARDLAVLLVELRSPDRGRRAVAARELGELGDSEAVEPLIAALAAWGDEGGYAAAFALGELGDARAVEPLVATLRTCPTAEFAATRALEQIGAPGTVEMLVAALDEDDFPAWRAEVRALQGLGWQPEDDVRRAKVAVATGKWERAGAVGAAAVAPLVAALRHGAPEAAERLGLLGDPAAVEPLIEALGSPRSAVRRAAAEALWRMPDRRAVAPLVGLLDDPDDGVRDTAAAALGAVGDPSVVDPLLAALARDVRGAARALGQLGDPRAVEPLVTALAATRWVADAAEQGLVALGEQAAPAIGRMVDHPDAVVRARAVEALWQIADPRSQDALLSALSDPETGVRRLAALGLTAVAADAGALEQVVAAIGEEKEEQVRSQLALAVAAMAGRDVPGAREALARLEGTVPGG